MTIAPEVRRILDSTALAHIATVLPDGSPHTVPLWIGTHLDHIVFLTHPRSRKARNLRRDPRVAFSLVPDDDPTSPVIIRGQVAEWIDGELAWEIIDQISTKYTGAAYPRDQDRVVIAVEPHRQKIGIG